ncbi:MAG TPA: HAMP domain-containing sensor histidine kinase [Ktedonobacterales bacterium]|nr:HAMP domain-containing sensor histidine kinase [Ktedonobacterales bacterium]
MTPMTLVLLDATLATYLAFASIASLVLCLLVGLLCLIFQFTDRRRLTVRRWLALAWLATLFIPAVVDGAFIILYQIVKSVNAQNPYPLDPFTFAIAVVAVPLVTLVLTMLGIAWLLRPALLHPLATMSQAARQVASGDLDVTVPASGVREVAEVAAAFTAMGGGLRASLERQAEIEQERRLFVSAIAHDLRTPLFSLRGYLEGLETGVADTPERRARYVAVCREQADRLEQLVAGLFAYARLEYLNDTPRREPVDLVTLLHSAVESMQPQAAEKHITLTLEGMSGAGYLEGDAHLLTRAVENLLDNALRHTPAHGQILVRTWREGARSLFSVADSGVGISPHDLAHIFDPVYRGDASRNQRTGGAGLGLTIARRILHAHGGALVAANGERGGAVFTAWVPSHSATHISHFAPPEAILAGS